VLIWLKFISAFLQPPGLNILLCLIGLYCWIRSSDGWAAFFLGGSTILLYLLSVPMISDKLLLNLESKYQSSKIEELINQKDPKAIVVLSSGMMPASNWLLSNQYAAQIARATKLPVLVSGGNLSIEDNNQNNEAILMGKSLVADFNITGAIWVESDSHSIQESAKLSKQILDKNSIKNVFLVTNAWHMTRAIQAFKKQGIDVVPAPILTNLEESKANKLKKYTPSVASLLRSECFFYEYLGDVWGKVLDVVRQEG